MAKNPVKITILVDNYASEGLMTEHGFAAWVEAGDLRILFDTGQLEAIHHNSERLGIDIYTANKLVLSHGHFDHTGNLHEVLSRNQEVVVYMGKSTEIDRWSCKPGTDPRSIGIPEKSRKALEALPAERLKIVEEAVYLAPGVGITGPVPRFSDFEDTGGPFFLDNASQDADLIEDDQSMWFETDDGLIVLLGCCHSGIVNTIAYIRKISGMEKIRGIVGGMHLVNADQNRLDETLRIMKEWNPEFLAPCHCTGDDAMDKMVHAIGDQIVCKGHVGLVVGDS